MGNTHTAASDEEPALLPIVISRVQAINVCFGWHIPCPTKFLWAAHPMSSQILPSFRKCPETKHSEPNWFRRFCQKICPGCFNGDSTPATKIEAGNEKLTTPSESANVIRIPGEQEDGVLKEEKSERNGVRSSNVEQASERKGKGNASLGENE
ncbi:hypothetical protein Patl1_27611 [Pistacia atlantica]|uniref:Uncharacterized protein n=1 Tax=Pistacia atlantica TaxID=434234 RepID=A0ACC1BGH9_9ROSI|nr:hypothetical protein Patl1_27611 [Pistacia atlantica]